MQEQKGPKNWLKNWVVTIDGPAASGKSSVSRELARRLSCKWVSTGAFYRGLAYVASATQTDLTDEPLLVDLANSHEWSVSMDPDCTRFWFQGKDVTALTKHEAIGNIASQISQFPIVRMSLLQAQRACAPKEGGLIAEGRDCGSVVFPDALIKIYLTARSENRAARRAKEEGSSITDIQAAQKVRDQQDRSRKTAPLQVPDRAHIIDASELSLDEVVDQVEQLVRKALAQ